MKGINAMKKKLLSVGIAVCILLGFAVVPTSAEVSAWDGSVAAGFESGSGTEEDPYIIKTAPQLAYLAQRVNSGRTYEGQYILLVNDIVLNTSDMFATDENGNITGAASGKTPTEWTAIGNWNSFESPFRGTFDGGNHEVKGIYINKPETSYQGLFGCCQNATIKNVCVTGGYICGRYYVGGVVGDNDRGTVSYCYNTGSVTGSGDFVGGVVGRNLADSSGSIATVLDCYNTGSVTGDYCVGGVVGGNFADSSGSTATVSNCYNTGSVTGGEYVGGVVGDNDSGTVSDCYNTGSVTGRDFVGGVVGRHLADSSGSTATVLYCYNTGSVRGSDFVGGVVGENDYGTVLNCYNTGSVTGSIYVGGVVGYNIAYSGTAAVSDCYNTGSVTGSSNFVGGVVGENYYGTVSNCYNTGMVNGSYWNVGGVVGENYYGTVSNCYNTGSVMGNSGVGGVVGVNNYYGTVSNCYNTGSVTGGEYVGGVVGDNDSGTVVSDCYYLDSCIETANDYGVALTSSQMEQQESFDGFDFDTVWTMGGNPDYPYPELIGMYYGGEAPTIDEPTIIESGTCGDNLTWTLDDEGTLTISGTGNMKNFLISPFDGNGNIKSIIIENGVTSIGDYAFWGCSSLTSVEISESLTRIGIGAFGWCDSLTSIKIPEGITIIDDVAFRYCAGLTSIEIPKSVTSIAGYAFDDCTNLADVYYNGNEKDWNNITINSGNELLLNAARHYLAPPATIIYGDVNGDESVTVKDDAFLARYLAHWIGYDETNVDLDAADVNADGKVGVRDNAILARFIARWTGYEELPYVR